MTATQRNYWLTWTTSLLFFVAFYTLLVPLPLYLVAIGLPDWQIGVIMGAFGVASLIGRPLAGFGADRWGYRPVMLCGVAALLVGVAGVNTTTNPIILFLLRLFQATGYIAFTTASNALVVALTPANQRKSMLTRFGAAANVAMTITPATINALLPLLTFNGALWVSGLFALISGGLALQVRGIPPSLASSASGLTRPRIPRSVVLPLMLAAVCGVGFGAFLQFLPLLTERRGSIASGPVFATYGAGIALTRLLIARWMDKGDQRLILRIGYGLVALGLFFFAIGQHWLTFALAALCLASGAGMQTGLLMSLHVEALPAARASAIAFYYLGSDLGIGGGAWLLAPVLQHWGIGGLYLCAAVISLLGAVMVQFIQQKPPVTEAASMRVGA